MGSLHSNGKMGIVSLHSLYDNLSGGHTAFPQDVKIEVQNIKIALSGRFRYSL
jgi:hypothetical protein